MRFRGALAPRNGAEHDHALQAEVGEITQPEPAPAQPDETVSEADAEANKAIEYLNNVMDMQSTDMAEIRNARGNVREAMQPFRRRAFEETKSWLMALLATWLICW
ncbi:internal head protein [Escherichia coli]|uniref:Internal head protein n=1 Tax=Escherichia coli TaxID=562 RepID=A0AB38GWV5_ECOLX|nr:internal head protein [Escherichia coli]